MKLRADRFEVIADDKALYRIQGEVQRYKDELKCEDIDDANKVLNVYAAVAFDEGYRRAIEDLHESSDITIKNLKSRKKNKLEYVEEGEIRKLKSLFLKRINSKRQRKAIKKNNEENGIEFCEEWFYITMVIHTGFENGYLKGSSLEEMVKWLDVRPEAAEMAINIMREAAANLK